jgi:capsular polysaccharide biosynthesis protein
MTGCNSVEEVEDGCETGIEDSNLSETVIIYPNPASDIIHITIPTGETIESVKIYNTSGQLMIHQLSTEIDVNISDLNTGMYICELEYKGTIARKLIVKID